MTGPAKEHRGETVEIVVEEEVDHRSDVILATLHNKDVEVELVQLNPVISLVSRTNHRCRDVVRAVVTCQVITARLHKVFE